MISLKPQNFYELWLQQAGQYRNDNLQDCFGKFFTLFVACNRLYAELTLSLFLETIKGLFPNEAIFTEVIHGGSVRANDEIRRARKNGG